MSRRDQTQQRRRPTHHDSTRPRRRARISVALGVVALGLVGAACDTGDGKTLPEPTGTLPSTTIAPASPLDGGGTLASVALEPSVFEDVTLPTLPTSDDPFTIVAPWFDGGPIDPINSCDGGNLSPALSWTDVPEGTSELALSLVDESVDGPPFVHWVIAGLSPADTSISEGTTPAGAVQAVNFFGNIGYDGPCPPPRDPAHVYRLTIYALNQQVELADGSSAGDLLDFVQNVAIASDDVVGTFER